MATMVQLAQQGKVFRYDPDLSWRQQEFRPIYLLPRARKWMEEDLPNLSSDWYLEIEPVEQVIEFLEHFCAGEELTYDRQFHPMRHVDAGVWELKTADVRLFGWFYAKDCFVCSCGDSKSRIKTHNLYGGYRDEAVRLRDGLELDEPKFIPGDDPNDVVSNFSFP